MASAGSTLPSSPSLYVAIICVVSTQLMLVTETGAFADMKPSQIPGTKPALTPRDYFRQHAHAAAA